MDPHADKLPDLGLPPLSLGQEGMQSSSESGGKTSMGMPPVTPFTSIAPAVAPTSHPAALGVATPQPAPIAPIAADDGSDALDEEWVNKAKAVVEQTKDDPFIESNQLSKVKANYLNIRYNKHIKVAEDHL